ncbi:hypothetical protein EV182_003779, partial [Spiromyces aspiralis]
MEQSTSAETSYRQAPTSVEDDKRRPRLPKFTIEKMASIDSKKKARSYAELLEPEHTLGVESASAAPSGRYDPMALDAQYFEGVQQRATAMYNGFMGSFLHPGRQDDVRPEEERIFNERYPYLESNGFTLEHLRRMKHSMIKMVEEANFEASSVALAFVYYEKLVLEGYVVKDNRKLVA